MNIEKLSGPKLEALLAAREATHSGIIDELIAAGYGSVTSGELRSMAKNDPSNRLIARYVSAADACNDAYEELQRRKRWHGGNKPIRRTV